MGNNITQKLKYKQSVVKFSYKYGVTKAAIKFGECKRTIYRWRERYDGSLESLKDKSRRPHSHPNQHTVEEIRMIKNYKANNKETGLVVLWIKLKLWTKVLMLKFGGGFLHLLNIRHYIL